MESLAEEGTVSGGKELGTASLTRSHYSQGRKVQKPDNQTKGTLGVPGTGTSWVWLRKKSLCGWSTVCKGSGEHAELREVRHFSAPRVGSPGP